MRKENGAEGEGRCSKTGGYDKRLEVEVFLLVGLQLPKKVRGRVVELKKTGEDFQWLCEIRRGDLGHIQGNKVKRRPIQGHRPQICRVQIC